MGPSQACRHRSQAGSACGGRVPPKGTQRVEAALARLEDPLLTQPRRSVGTASSPRSGTLAPADSSPGRHLHGTLGQPAFWPPDGPQKGGGCPQSTWGIPCWAMACGDPSPDYFPTEGALGVWDREELLKRMEGVSPDHVLLRLWGSATLPPQVGVGPHPAGSALKVPVGKPPGQVPPLPAATDCTLWTGVHR